jgi:hypothetical protein
MEDRACDWVAGIRRYYDATGDTALLREIWPAVVAQMNYFLDRRTPRGLVRARDWVVWGNPLGYATGETTTLNVFVQRALADSAFLGNLIGTKADAQKFSRAAADLAGAVNTVLWNEADGSYFSAYFDDADAQAAREAADTRRRLSLPVTDHRTPATLHANLFALDCGVVPPARRSRVLEHVVAGQQSFMGKDVMLYYYLARQLYGLDQSALDTRVLDLFRQNWADMVAYPWQCSWESLSYGSKAHIYGMFPGYFLSAYVLGVRRDAPVTEKKLLIEPHLGDLTEAAGVVVTEFGPVPVSWKREGGRWQFAFTAPAGVKTVLSLPCAPGLDSVSLDGKTISVSAKGSRLELIVYGGRHQGNCP